MKFFKKAKAKVRASIKTNKLRAKKRAPELLLIGGVIITGVAVVKACKATLKVNDILDDYKADKEKIDNAVKEGKSFKDDDGKTKKCDEAFGKEQRRCLWRDTAIKFVKTYAVPGCLFILGMACFCSSTVILRKREKAAVTLANGTLAAWNAYRARVKEAVGEEVENNIYFDRKEDPNIMATDENGEWRPAVTEAKDPGHPFVFKFNSQTSRFFEDDPQYNMIFLQQAEEEFQEMVFEPAFGQGEPLELNQVLKRLGMKKDSNLMTAGWVPSKMGGHVKSVSFGLEKYKRSDEDGGIDIDPDEIILEFNCEYIDGCF